MADMNTISQLRDPWSPLARVEHRLSKLKLLALPQSEMCP
jgi:hypothetical protein